MTIPAHPAEHENDICWIRNSSCAAMIYLPDPITGHYRGPRFDWSGMIGKVIVGNRTFFGPHHPGRDDPASNDCNAVGPANEFGTISPLGYAEAQPSGTFIKIGVGYLAKSANEQAYNFLKDYTVVKPLPWIVHTAANSISFHQELSDPNGWGYTYEKTISLAPDEPELIIHHCLRNTGARTIDTDQYCHNFVTLGHDRTGMSHFVELSFDASAIDGKGNQANLSFSNRRLTILHPFMDYQWANGQFLNRGNQANPYRVVIGNNSQSIQISADQPPVATTYYVNSSVLCVEPFLLIHILPGQEFSWHEKCSFMCYPGLVNGIGITQAMRKPPFRIKL